MIASAPSEWVVGPQVKLWSLNFSFFPDIVFNLHSSTKIDHLPCSAVALPLEQVPIKTLERIEYLLGGHQRKRGTKGVLGQDQFAHTFVQLDANNILAHQYAF